jgi:hypothetical protein
MYNTTNRVLAMIEKRRGQIASGVKPDGSPITADLAELEKSLDNSLVEVFTYQNLKSRAQLAGLLNTDEAMTIYAALGREAPGPNGWAPDADLATKVVVTGLMGELITRV